MRPDLPWNVAGIPSEAREAARAAARREGLSIGEWLTRRILAGLSGMNEPAPSPSPAYREEWSSSNPGERAAETRRDSDEMLDRVSRSETETGAVARRIEEQLRSMARRLDSSERSQSESNRAMSNAAVEMNIAAREQAQAFDQLGTHVVALSERLERVESKSGDDGLRDAVKALHHGLSRLADQIAQTAGQSETQISALASNLESLAGRLGQARQDTEAANRTLERTLAALDERVRTVEKSSEANTASLERALKTLETRQAAAGDNASATITRLEESVSKLESRAVDPALDRRLSGIERTLANIIDRIDHDERAPRQDGRTEESIKKLAQRLDSFEVSQREAMADLRKALAAPPPPKPEEPPLIVGAASAPPFAAAPSAPLGFEAPPFAGALPPFAETGMPPPFESAADFGAAANPGLAPPAGGTVASYLSAARASARAAAEAETAHGAGGFGGFAWGAASAAKPAEPSSAKRSVRLGIIVLLLVVAIAVLASVILSRRMPSESLHNSAFHALLDKKPATPPKIAPAPTGDNDAVAAPGVPQVRHSESAVPTNPMPAQPAPLKPVDVVKPLVQQRAAIPALDRLTAMANAGNAKAELVVGLKYLDGDGVAANPKEAVKWLERAADAGEPVAQYRLGTMYERGRGVAADPAKAIRLYLSAAGQGNRKAMHNLAVAYAEGSGTKKDYIEASRWFTRAANLGLSDSQFNLAVLYERGLGVPQSLLDAYKWYAVAGTQGDAESKARIGAISAQLGPDDRAAAQHAADTFKPAPLDARSNVAPTIANLPRG